MTQQQTSIGQEQADRLSARLQVFYDALPEDEQAVMRAIMQQAQGEDDVTGYVTEGGCIRMPTFFPALASPTPGFVSVSFKY